jgi:hypothetical protein
MNALNESARPLQTADHGGGTPIIPPPHTPYP